MYMCIALKTSFLCVAWLWCETAMAGWFVLVISLDWAQAVRAQEGLRDNT